MNRTQPQKKISAWRKALTLLLAGMTALPQGALLAQTVPSGATSTTVLPNGSGNGVPVVNIAAPNAAGLSHNKFNSYNVPVQGQILNNATAATVQTQLGGTILGNPNLAGKSAANVILNEVVQPNRSLLQGYQEVAGQAAQVVVANPYGITCTGCGFINTPRATLTTGTPNIDAAGNLTGFAVRQGDILINGAGLDAGAQNFFELVSRSVVLQGQVNARDLLVAAGSNDFDYLARTVTPAAAAGAAPAYAIDSSALGGMYVDRIRMIATEAGVGVRLLGNVGASVDDITISAAGKIELQNQMSAQRDIAVTYTGGSLPPDPVTSWWQPSIEVNGGAQVYAGRNLSLAGGVDGVRLGNATIGAGGNLDITGSAFADRGSAADYRFANGALSVNISGVTLVGDVVAGVLTGGTYDAQGALTISGGIVTLYQPTLVGRSAAAGVTITSASDLVAYTAQVTTPGSVVLNAAGAMELGTAYVAAGGDITANFGGNFSISGYQVTPPAGAPYTETGSLVANGNLRLLNTSASATITNDGYLEAGSMTIGTASLGSFSTGQYSSTIANTLTVRAPTVDNAGYLQAASASFVSGASLTNAATGTMVLGTTNAHNNLLSLGQLSNSGMIYSAGSLNLSANQFGNLSGGKIVVDGQLDASASSTFANAGSIDGNDVNVGSPSINLTGGSLYAGHNLGITTGGTVTMGGSAYAANDFTLDANTIADTATGPTASRGAGRNFTITTPNNLDLYSGQVYDAGKTLSITAPKVRIGANGNVAGTSRRDTTLSAGGTLSNEGIVIHTDELRLGSEWNPSLLLQAAAGSLQSAGNITLAPRTSTLSVSVENHADPLGGHRSSIQAGGNLSSRADSFTVDGDVLANGNITLLPVANGGTSSLVINNGGWMESAGTLSLTAGQFDARGFNTTINPGGTLAGNNFDIFNGDLTIGNTGLLQGGTAGGNIDVGSLNLVGSSSQLWANRADSAQTIIRIGGAGTAPFNNFGLLYAQGSLTLYTNGDIVNTTLGSIASGFGDLTINTRNQSWGANGRLDNQGVIYAGRDLAVYVPQDGTLYNHPSGTIGAGRNATLGIYYNPLNPAPAYQSTFKNEGRVDVDGDADINAHYFYNNVPTSIVRNPTHLGETRVYSIFGDSGRYGLDAPSIGYDSSAAYVAGPGHGNGTHTGKNNYRSSGVNYYFIDGNPNKLYRDFQVDWSEKEEFTNPTAATPKIYTGGTLTIRTHTGENLGGDIYGGDVLIQKLHTSMTGTSFTNKSLELTTYMMRSFGRTGYDCGNGTDSDALCSELYNPNGLGDFYSSFPTGTPGVAPGPNWGANDSVPQEIANYVDSGSTRVASVRAAHNVVPSVDVFIISSSTDPAPVVLLKSGGVPTGSNKGAAPAAGSPTPVTAGGATPLTVGGASVTLPTGPNGLFVLSTNPNAKYLVESNPLYLSAYNPFLGSEYLAGLLEINPAKEYLRLGDANYEARLIREQVLAQTGASILRTAYDANDQQKLLMDNAVLEVKELKLNWGTALTAAQVASLKHDIVWMVEQKVQGKSVLVPVVYLTDATRANVSGASIVAENAIVTGDSFLNKGGQVQASNQLVVVTRKDIVNISGDISGGNVQMQSLEGDIINRTNTVRSGEAGNFTTTAGRSGGIYASNSLFMKAARDVDVLGATVESKGTATVVAGRDINVSALVLDARSTSFADRSTTFNKDVSRSVETTQTAQNATISGGTGTALIAKQDVNVTGAYVGSKDGTTSLISEKGKVNVGALALTNTRTESSEKVGFFGEGRVGATAGGQDAALPQSEVTGPQSSGRANSLSTVDSQVTRDTPKPAADPNANTVEGFAGLAIQKSQASSSATSNMGSMIEGGGVNIIAKAGNVNITGSQVNSGAKGTLIDAARDVNIMAAYDSVSSTRKEETVRVGVAGEAGPGGAYAGVKVDGSTLDSQTSSRTAGVSSLGSQGSINIRAGGTLTNEGTSVDAKQDINVQAAKVDNRAAQNTTTSNVRSSNFSVDLMGGVTTGGIGESVAGLAQGTGKELNIGSPEAQARLRASGGSSTTTGSTSTAVVTQLKSGGNTNFQVSGAMLDEGTSYDAGRNINMNVGSYENRQATNTSTGTVNSTSGGGTLTVGIDASTSVNANASVQGRNEQSSTSSSTAVVGGLKAGGNVNITSKGNVMLQGTTVGAGNNVNVDAGGKLELLQANNTSSAKSNTSEGSANLSASACADLSCVSGGGGASARTTTLDENTRTGVAGSISGANVNLKSGGNMTLQGTNIAATNNTTLSAGGNVDFQALTSTISSRSTADGGGADLSANVGATGKIASDGGGGGSVNFERGRGATDGTVRQGGTVTSGGTFTLNSGGNARLEGTNVQASNANLNVGGNLLMESAQSTLVQDNSNVTGGVQVSAGKSADGGRNFGGAVSLDVSKQTADNLTNQNAGITTTGKTNLNVGGNATLSGANIDAGGGVGGKVQGNLLVETRADREKTENTTFSGYVGIGNIQIAGKGDGSKPSMADNINAAQDKIGNVANAAGGTGVFINLQSETKDNVTIGQRSGISGGAGGLGGLSVGGNATLSGAQNTQGINVQGTTTTSGGPQTKQESSSTDFTLRGTVASMAGSDQGSGGTFNNVFQASGGGHKPEVPDTAGPVTRPRSGAVSGEDARPRNIPGTPGTSSGPVTLHRPTDSEPSGSFQPPVKPGAAQSTFKPDLTPGSPGVIPPGRPRSESNAPDTRPTGPESFGSFTPPVKPGAAPSTFKPDGPNLGATGRDRSPSVGPESNPSAKPRPDFVPPTMSGPMAQGSTFTPTPKPGPDLGATGRDRSPSVGPEGNPNAKPRPDFVPTPPSGATPQGSTFTPNGPDLGAPGRARSESNAPDTRPTGPEKFGSFATPEKPGAAPSMFAERPAFVPGVTPSPDAVTNVKPAPTPFVPGVKPSQDAPTNVKPDSTPFARSVTPSPDGVTNVKPAAVPAKPAANDGPVVAIAAAKPAAPAGQPTGLRELGPGMQWSQDGKFRLKKLGGEYQGEDRGAGARWNEGKKDTDAKVQVHYFDAKERSAAEIVIQNGLLFAKKQDADGNVLRNPDGSPMLTPYDTKDRKDKYNDDRGAIFVMDGEGRLFATTAHEAYKVHHSSLLAGEPVGMAGEIRVTEGKITYMNNMSGHYRPGYEQFSDMNKHLKSQGVTLSGVPMNAVTPIYRPEDKQHTGSQTVVEFDMATGAITQFHNRGEVNPNGPVFGGIKFSERAPVVDKGYVRLEPERRQALEVVVNAGGELVYRSDPSKKFDSDGKPTKFVLDAVGQMFAVDPAAAAAGIGHSGLANGGAVRMAGEIQVKDGRVQSISNKSDEYATSREQVKAFNDAFGSMAKLNGTTREMWEAQAVPNADGTVRPVMLQVDINNNKVLKIEDPFPQTPPAPVPAPAVGAPAQPDKSSANDAAWARVA